MILSKAQIELICVNEFIQFIQRHRRYAITVALLYVRAFLTLKSTTVLRAAYAFTQGMDDILDADRPFNGDRTAFGEKILAELKSGAVLGSDNMSHLLRYILQSTSAAEVKTNLIALMEILIADNKRMTARAVWSETQLRDHHRQTFMVSCRLLMALSDQTLSDDILIPVANSLAWCSVMRDLEDDLARGLNNIPQNVMGDEAIKDWIKSENQWGRQEIDSALTKLHESQSPFARVLLLFVNSIESYHRRYQTRYEFLA